MWSLSEVSVKLEILGKKEKKIWLSHLNESMSALKFNSSVVSAVTTVWAPLFQWGIVLGKKEYFRASLEAWGLQYCELCDDLVDLILLDGVKYLSLSIDIIIIIYHNRIFD